MHDFNKLSLNIKIKKVTTQSLIKLKIFLNSFVSAIRHIFLMPCIFTVLIIKFSHPKYKICQKSVKSCRTISA